MSVYYPSLGFIAPSVASSERWSGGGSGVLLRPDLLLRLVPIEDRPATEVRPAIEARPILPPWAVLFPGHGKVSLPFLLCHFHLKVRRTQCQSITHPWDLLPGLTSGSWGPDLLPVDSGLLPLETAEVFASPSGVSTVRLISADTS